LFQLLLDNNENQKFACGEEGILEPLPFTCIDDYKVIEIGIEMFHDAHWELVATTEQRMKQGVCYGTLMPQCILELKDLIPLSKTITSILSQKTIIGYVTIQILAWIEEDSIIHYSISDFFPFLTLNIIKAASLAVKCRLQTDHESFSMVSKHMIHWKLPYLGTCEYADHVSNLLYRTVFLKTLNNLFRVLPLELHFVLIKCNMMHFNISPKGYVQFI
jgi:hypothetical protein